MKTLLMALAAGMSLVAPFAHAALHVETPTIILDVTPTRGDNVTLLSSNDYVTQVSMTETLRRFGELTYTNVTGWLGGVERWQDSEYNFAAQQGYRITSVDFTFTYTGNLEQAAPRQWDPTYAGNYTSNKIYFGSFSSPHDQFFFGNQEGTVTGTLTTGELTRTTPFKLITNLYGLVQADGTQPIYDWDGTLLVPAVPSFAELRMTDAIMTIHTVPVPEPETYAMLLAGLALVGTSLRRRRR